MRTENLLHRLFMASFAAYDEDRCRTPQWGYDAVKWYIETGRASLEFIKACEALSDRRMITLIRKASVGCTDDGVAAARKYLKAI